MIELKRKLQKKDITIGSWITMGNNALTEIMASSGFDWLTIDLEHSSLGINDAAEMIRIIDLSGITPLVRISDNNPTLIKRVMDAGSHGIIVPMVNTKDDAEKAVSAVRYPPNGNRGVGLSRAQGYGTKFGEYIEWLGKESVVIVQIEHIKAVENLSLILGVEGVDGLIVGPYDLSGSIGFPGEFDHPLMLEALAEIKSVSSGSGVTLGYHVVQPFPEQVIEKIQEGYRFIAYSVDFLLLGDTCRRGIMEIRKNINIHEA